MHVTISDAANATAAAAGVSLWANRSGLPTTTSTTTTAATTTTSTTSSGLRIAYRRNVCCDPRHGFRRHRNPPPAVPSTQNCMWLARAMRGSAQCATSDVMSYDLFTERLFTPNKR